VKVLILTELHSRSRIWEGAIPILREEGHAVTMATVQGPGPLHEAAAELGAEPLALGCQSARDYPRGVITLARRLRRAKIDVVHSCEAIPAAIGGIAGTVARSPGRLYHWQHSAAHGRLRKMSRIGARSNHLIMACSMAAADYAVRGEGVPRSRVRVAHNGVVEPRKVTEAEIRDLGGRLGIGPEHPVVVAVSRLRREKGLATLVESIGETEQLLGRRVAVVIVGDGPERGALEALAGRVAPDRVSFVGHQQDVAPWFALADVVAMPSEREAFGFSAVEAMASGRALVASGVGGLVEIVEDGVTGRLVAPGDSSRLAAGLADVLCSPEAAAAMGAAGYERYRSSFTMRSMVSGWLDCYAETGSNTL
jgi:glycosyltransferase involved in cell wall biosynthesis